MAKSPAHSSFVYADEFNLSGYLNAFELGVDQENIDVTTFADAGPRRLVGNYQHKGSVSGFFDGVDNAFDEQVYVDLNTDEDHYLLKGPGAIAEGGIGYEQIIRLAGQPRSGQNGGAVLLNFSDEGSGGIARSTVLRSAAITTTGNGTGRNMGASTSGQVFQVVFRVISVSGSGTIAMKIQESQNDGGADAYADVSGLTSGSLTAVGVVRVTTTAATEAWKRVVISTFSGFTSVTVLVTAGIVAGT